MLKAFVLILVTFKVTISGFDLKDFKQCLKKWNAAMSAMVIIINYIINESIIIYKKVINLFSCAFLELSMSTARHISLFSCLL